MSVSLLDSMTSLSAAERTELLAELTDEEAAALLYDWEFWARESQREPTVPWRIWLVLAGRGYGKTRVGAEWVRKSARDFEYVNIAGATADDARDIMIEGESGIMAICPPWERPEYRRSLRRLDWPSGAKSLIFTADEPERFRGKQHARLWADELAAWRYEESWDQAVLGLRLGPDPRALITTTPKPKRILRDLISDPAVVVTKGSTYENRDNLPQAFFAELIGKYEGTRLGRQELEAELLLDEGLAYRFSERVHVVQPFTMPSSWDRFESVDYGWLNPSAWLAWAVDEAGNAIVFDGVYEAGWPSDLVPVVAERRRKGWQPAGKANVAWADPTMWNRTSTTPRFGDPASAADEFEMLGLPLAQANNDRRAGFLRISELLREDERRVFPDWHPRKGEPGSPWLFVVDTPGTRPLIDQLLDAPIEEADAGTNKGPYPGEAVAVQWERSKGHAHAALRYGAMTRPSPSEQPPQYVQVIDEAEQRGLFVKEWYEKQERERRRSPKRRTERL